MKVTEVANNYINGNLSDFRENLKKISKKELLLVIVHIAEYLSVNRGYENSTFSDNGYYEAIKIVDKYI